MSVMDHKHFCRLRLQVWAASLHTQTSPHRPDPASLAQVWSMLEGNDHSPSHHSKICMPFLGQLLVHLIVCWTCKIWEVHWGTLDALHYLFQSIWFGMASLSLLRGLLLSWSRDYRGLHSSVLAATRALLATSKPWFSVGPAHWAHGPNPPSSP